MSGQRDLKMNVFVLSLINECNKWASALQNPIRTSVRLNLGASNAPLTHLLPNAKHGKAVQDMK